MTLKKIKNTNKIWSLTIENSWNLWTPKIVPLIAKKKDSVFQSSKQAHKYSKKKIFKIRRLTSKS